VVETLCRLSPEVKQATVLTRRFIQLVRERQADQLNEWMSEVESSQLPELKAFARGLDQDRVAIEAALHEEWSNGRCSLNYIVHPPIRNGEPQEAQLLLPGGP
jgi:transposase